VDLVTFVEKQVGEVAAVLARDACDECFFHAGCWKISVARVDFDGRERKRRFHFALGRGLDFVRGYLNLRLCS
jgi:hypothetical protein